MQTVDDSMLMLAISSTLLCLCFRVTSLVVGSINLLSLAEYQFLPSQSEDEVFQLKVQFVKYGQKHGGQHIIRITTNCCSCHHIE